MLAYWIGQVAPSIRPDGGFKGDDLFGYFFPKYVLTSQLGGWTHLPLWNPYELAGVPLLGMSQPAALYPPRLLLFALLPPDLALQVFVVLHYLLLGLGCFVLARALRIGTAGAWLMTLVVVAQPMMLTAVIAPHWIAAFTWVPFALAAALRLADAPGPAPVLGLALAMTAQLLAGYPEYVFDTSVALGVVWICTLPASARRGGSAALLRALAAIVAASIVTLLLGAPQLCAFFEAYRESVREAIQFPQSLLEILRSGGASVRAIAAIYVAIPPPVALGLALMLVAGGAAYRGTLLALLALCIASLTVLDHVPPFSMSRSSVLCWGTIAHVALGGLAGIGLDRYLAGSLGDQRVDATARRLSAWLATALAIAAFALYTVPARLILCVSLVLLVVAGIASPRVRSVAIVLLLVLVPFRASMVPEAVQRGIAYPSIAAIRSLAAPIAAACRLGEGGRVVAPEETFSGVLPIARLPSPQGYPESLSPRRLGRLLDGGGLGMSWVNRIDWNRLIAHPALLDLLDVRCVVAPRWLTAPLVRLGFTLGPVVTPDGRLAFRRDGSAARLLGRSLPGSDDAVFDAVTRAGFEPARVVMTEAGPATTGAAGHVEAIGSAEPGRHAFRTVSRDPGYLVVSETWYPGWRARLDGRAATVARVDYAFLGVAVPAGSHAVELFYRPLGFDVALALAALGGACTLALALAAWRAAYRAAPFA